MCKHTMGSHLFSESKLYQTIFPSRYVMMAEYKGYTGAGVNIPTLLSLINNSKMDVIPCVAPVVIIILSGLDLYPSRAVIISAIFFLTNKSPAVSVYAPALPLDIELMTAAAFFLTSSG